MKCPCCGNEVCPFNALLEYIHEQEVADEEAKRNNAQHVNH